MKKLFALLAVAFGVMSCQADPEGFGANVGGEQDVNITVSLPEATRGSENGALENGVLNSHDLRYILEIAYNNEVYRDVEISNATSATFPVRLAPGREYEIAVWADFVEKGTTAVDADLYYETSAGLANISIIDGAPMTEARDAFCGRYTLASDKSVASIPTITLTRPFAKVRVVTTDVEDLAKIGVALPTSATITYATDVAIYNKFNAFTGDVASENALKEHTFNYANTYAVENGEMTLFADYLFVPQNGSITHFTLNVTDHVNKSFTTDIPVVANKLTTIKGDILTNGSDIKVEIENSFAGEDSFVQNVNAAQSAIDNAIANTTIYLEPGVDYGTLLIRPVAGAANTITDCDYLNYRNEMLRKVENLTIIGAPGATVDAIKVVAGHIEGSTGYVVDIKNLVIDSVEFNDTYTNAPHSYAAPVFIDLTYTNVNGLTVKNCKLIGDNNKMNFVYIYGSGKPSNSTFETAAKNIVITNNTVDGIARLCELRQTENVTITNNLIKNTYLHGILLPVDGGTYSGDVIIENNIADGIKERFVRMAGAGDAAVVIKNNSIANYLGEDTDYIKVTDGSNVTIENNVITEIANNTADLQAALAEEGTNVVLANDLTITPEEMTTAPYGNQMALSHKGGIFNGNGKNLSVTANGDNYVVMTNGGTIKNLDIDRGFRGIILMYPNQDVYIDNVKIGVDDEVCYTINTAEGDGTQSLYVSNSVLNGWCSIGTAVKDVYFTNCTFGQGTYYTNVWGRLVKPYVDAVFNGCDFCDKCYIDLSAFAGTKVIVKNCSVNGVKITAENWTSLVAPEDTCGEGQISVELKNGTFLTAENVVDYIVFE